MKARKWLMEYGVAIVMASLFAVILGQIPLFRETAMGKLRASDLVQFIGYSGSLVTAWLGALKLSKQVPEEWAWAGPFQALILPLATLLTVSMFYGVLLYAVGPFLGKSAKVAYNWVFIAAIIASSVWLVFSWIRKCAPLMAVSEPRRLRKVA